MWDRPGDGKEQQEEAKPSCKPQESRYCLRRAYLRVIVLSWKEAITLILWCSKRSCCATPWSAHSLHCHLMLIYFHHFATRGKESVILHTEFGWWSNWEKRILLWSSRQCGVKIQSCVNLANWEKWELLRKQEFSPNLGSHCLCFTEVQAADRTTGLPWSPNAFNNF